MIYLLLKALLSGAIVAAVSEIARRFPGWGGLLASLPLVSLLAMTWLYLDTREPLKVVKILPKESTAGLVTGWRLSATIMPMSQAHDALACVPLSTTSSPADAPSGTRAMTKESEPIITGAPTSPMVTLGRSSWAKPLPRICNSPPAMAAGGVTWEMCGLESADLRVGIISKD